MKKPNSLFEPIIYILAFLIFPLLAYGSHRENVPLVWDVLIIATGSFILGMIVDRIWLYIIQKKKVEPFR